MFKKVAYIADFSNSVVIKTMISNRACNNPYANFIKILMI